jgi:hypothetical protein
MDSVYGEVIRIKRFLPIQAISVASISKFLVALREGIPGEPAIKKQTILIPLLIQM